VSTWSENDWLLLRLEALRSELGDRRIVRRRGELTGRVLTAIAAYHSAHEAYPGVFHSEGPTAPEVDRFLRVTPGVTRQIVQSLRDTEWLHESGGGRGRRGRLALTTTGRAELGLAFREEVAGG
jgi:hypothetical protein